MCGRFYNTYTWKQIHDLYMLTLGYVPGAGEWQGKVNIAPTTLVPVVRFIDGQRRVDLMRWGLIPAWSKEIGKFATFNARADGVTSKPAYRGAWKAGRRCIIPASAFFEWRKSDKQPFAIGLGNRGPLGFAGLWEEWKPKDGPPVLSCTIITTEANATMAPLHDRMPVILNEEDWALWLGEEPATEAQLLAMMRPCAPGRISLWPVDKAVGNVRNQSAGLIEAVRAEE